MVSYSTAWTTTKNIARVGMDQWVDLFLPTRCLLCGHITDGQGLHPQCWKTIRFFADPLCYRCGRALDSKLEHSPPYQCPKCIKHQPAWHHARAVFSYEKGGRDLVLSFKHGDRTDGVPLYARWLVRANHSLLSASPKPLLVPVPLHRWRLFYRRYNQSALLAQAMARIADCPYHPRILHRIRATQSQGYLSHAQRKNNIHGAIQAVIDPELKNRPIALIDDVMTSGATATACTQALYAAGSGPVSVLTLALVRRNQ